MSDISTDFDILPDENKDILTMDDVLYKQLSIGSFMFNRCYIGNDLHELLQKKKNRITPEKLTNLDLNGFKFIGTENSGKYLVLVDLSKVWNTLNLWDPMARDYLLGREIYRYYWMPDQEVVDTITGWEQNRKGFYMTTAGGRKLNAEELFNWHFYDSKERIASIYLKEEEY